MVLKIIALVIFIGILFSLGSGLYYLMRKDSNPRSVAIALTWRSALSLTLFALLLIGANLGWIIPHGIF